MRRLVYIALVACMVSAIMCSTMSCGAKSDRVTDTTLVADTLVEHHDLPDTLRVATIYSPLSYFLYREDTMGYDYTLVREFVEAKNMVLDLQIASSLEKAINMLDSGRVDLIAYEVPVTSEYVDRIYACGPENFTAQVLVQPTDGDVKPITDVTELVGRDVWVQPNSKYHQRLRNLNEELGGGINIHLIDRDTLIDEDIIEMVATGEIPLSVVDGDIARLDKTYYHNLDVSLEVSFRQRSSWGVSTDLAWLGDTITAWFRTEGTRRQNAELLRRYFELSKAESFMGLGDVLSQGRVSEYDDMFRKHAKRIGWDWRLLAAQGYVESRFDNDVVSWAGAKGLMQIMPSTARAYGVAVETLRDPETSISLAADLNKKQEEYLAKYIKDPSERRRFVVAAYNSGLGHILDAIALADMTGKNPEIWFDNVEQGLLLKDDARYYNDPHVKHGYFRGRQTTQYVRHVYEVYEQIIKKIKE